MDITSVLQGEGLQGRRVRRGSLGPLGSGDSLERRRCFRSSFFAQISSSSRTLIRREERQGGRGGRQWSNDRGESERRDRTAVIRRKKESTRWIGAISENHSFPSVKAQAGRQWRFRMRTTWNFSPTETSCPPSWAGRRGDEMEGGD